MTLRTRLRRRREPAVLRLSRGWAEWLDRGEDGALRCVRVPVVGSSPQALAEAATSAAANAPRGRRDCILALGHGLLRLRVVELPPMATAARRAVLARKAAALLETPQAGVLYAALELADEATAPASGGLTRWLLAAQERAFAVALRTALERGELRIVRAVSSGLAHLDAAQSLRGAIDPACIVLDVGEEEIGVGLIAGSAVHHMTLLPGNLATTPALAMTLLHELRTLEAFWRKESRGGNVGQVVLMGLDGERGEALGAAVRSVLPAAVLKADPAHSSAPGAGRLASLAACAAQGPFALEIGARRPVRTARVLALGAAVTALVGTFAVLSQRGKAEQARRLLDEARVLARAAADLEELRGATRHAEQALQALDGEMLRLQRTAELGVRLEDCLADVLVACGREAPPLALRVRAPWDGLPGELHVSGRTDADPLLSTRRLTELAARLERSPLFEDVQVLVPASLPEPRPGEAPQIEYGLAARYHEARP